MATTSRKITELALGMRDTAGAVVASGKARFYQPGTLVEQTVYSDDVCTSPIAQPVTLNAGGQGTVYTLEPVRMVVKDSTETTTYYDSIPNLNRHDAVYITHASINSGAETTLENFLTTATTSLGTDLQYKESSGATARNYSAWLGEFAVAVKDFGALGDDGNDDTAEIQAAYDRVKARGGGWVYWPKGTYKITSAITIDTAGVKTCGAGRGVAIIKNYGTTTNVFTVNLGSAVDAKMQFKDFSITASTTSSGAGIVVTNGDRVVISNVAVALHRTGIDQSATSGGACHDCFIESTDDNASAVGIVNSVRGRITDCEVNSATDNGTGINVGSDGRAARCYTTNFATAIHLGNRSRAHDCHMDSATTGVLGSGLDCVAADCYVNSSTTAYNMSGTDALAIGCKALTATTGFTLSGARSKANACHINGATTGFSLGVANATVISCHANTCTTGFSVGAFASCAVHLCHGTGNTTDLSVNTAATLLSAKDNTFAGVQTFNAATPRGQWRPGVNSGSTTSDAQTFTPDISGGKTINVFGVNRGGASTCTIAAHDTATLAVGDVLSLTVYKLDTGTLGVTFNAQYLTPDGSSFTTFSSSLTEKTTWTYTFRWNGTAFVFVGRTTAQIIQA